MSILIQGQPDTEHIKRYWGLSNRMMKVRVKRNARRLIARHSRNLNRRTGKGR